MDSLSIHPVATVLERLFQDAEAADRPLVDSGVVKYHHLYSSEGWSVTNRSISSVMLICLISVGSPFSLT